jgi:hypothetical protein
MGALAAIAAVATEHMWVAVPAVLVFGFCMSTAGIAIQRQQEDDIAHGIGRERR